MGGGMKKTVPAAALRGGRITACGGGGILLHPPRLQATHTKNYVFSMGPTSFADGAEQRGTPSDITEGVVRTVVRAIRRAVSSGIRELENPTRRRRVCHSAPAICTFRTKIRVFSIGFRSATQSLWYTVR